MNEKESTKKAIPPYVPYKTFINFIDNLRQGIPQRIDRSIAPFRSMSGALQGQVRLALEYLNLITDSGDTMAKLSDLVHSEEGPKREQILKDVLIPAYPFIFEDGLDLERATQRQLEERFAQVGATGDTLRKCVAFFLNAAKGAGIKLSPHFKKIRGPRTGLTRPKRISQPKPLDSIQIVKEPTLPPKAAEPTEDTTLEKLIFKKIPDFNPEWPEAVQKSWFEAINKLMDRFQKKSGD